MLHVSDLKMIWKSLQKKVQEQRNALYIYISSKPPYVENTWVRTTCKTQVSQSRANPHTPNKKNVSKCHTMHKTTPNCTNGSWPFKDLWEVTVIAVQSTWLEAGLPIRSFHVPLTCPRRGSEGLAVRKALILFM